MAATRKRMCARSAEGEETPSLSEVLRSTLEELREIRGERALQQQQQAAFEATLREKQQRQRAAFEAKLQQRDDEIRQLRERLQGIASEQLSPSDIREIAASACIPFVSRVSSREITASVHVPSVPSGSHVSPRDITANVCVPFVPSEPYVSSRGEVNVKLKPDTFDGSVPLREFFSQFDLIARANRWINETKTAVLVSCLRGKARAVLESVQNLDNLEYAELKSKLELRFGESQSLQNYYCQFTNRRQKFGENLTALGSDIERLSQLAYPECPHLIRDKIACAQFVSALSDGFVKRALQLEGVTSLRVAVERAKAVKLIQENSFEGKKENCGNFEKRKENNYHGFNGKGKDQNKNFGDEDIIKERKNGEKFERFNKNFVGIKNREKECWECGEKGHFRSECPSKEGNKDLEN